MRARTRSDARRRSDMMEESGDDQVPPEVAILVGLQGSGKSTFFRDRLAGTHKHVSKDNFRNARRRQDRQMRMITEALESGENVAVDNTNPSPAEWRPIIGLARRHGARVIGYWFPPDVPGSLRRNAARESRDRVPDVGIFTTLRRLNRPGASDGFDDLRVVRFDGAGGFEITDMAEEDQAGTGRPAEDQVPTGPPTGEEAPGPQA
jgi:predicted kinase